MSTRNGLRGDLVYRLCDPQPGVESIPGRRVENYVVRFCGRKELSGRNAGAFGISNVQKAGKVLTPRLMEHIACRLTNLVRTQKSLPILAGIRSEELGLS